MGVTRGFSHRVGRVLGAALAAALVLAAPAAAGPAVQTTDANGVIDWTRGMIIARGAAAADLRAPSLSIARIAAERRAHTAARVRLSKLARSMSQLRGEGNAGKAVATGAPARRFAQLLAESRVLTIHHASDGSVVVKAGIAIEAVRAAIAGPGVMPPGAKNAPSAVVIDARGVLGKPGLGLEILGGKERYVGPTVFHKSAASAGVDPRLGKKPYRVTATGYNNGVVKLPKAAASQVAAARKAGALVVLVLKAGK